MWLTAIAVTIAYFLIILLVFCNNFEYFIDNLTELNYTAIAVLLVLAYVLMLVVFLVVAYFVYSYRYTEAEEGIRVYSSRLSKIFKLNKADAKKRAL